MTGILTCRVSFPQLFMFIMFIIKFEGSKVKDYLIFGFSKGM